MTFNVGITQSQYGPGSFASTNMKQMKKNVFTALAAASICISVAQTPFFEKTCYRGSFAPAPTPMWTDNWTEWNPKNANYATPNLTVTADITSSTTWSTGQVILLSKVCYVKNNSVLTIQPGVIIRGDHNISGAALVVTRGSKVMAIGTVNQPIIFTSDRSVGQRLQGDWGGVILLGKATNNLTGGQNYIEGLPQSSDTQYGGAASPDDNDNSGTLKYVRIEFGGYVYQPNQEINGLTFGSVGRGTTIDYVQVSFANDDAFEWFGGTVNCKHLVAYRCLDDNFDTDNGFSGNIQFGLGVRDPFIADDPSVSTSEGFESDNDANGSNNMPRTAAMFSNMTDIGPLRGTPTNSVAAGFRRGARIRRNSNLKIYNSIFMDHSHRGVMIDGSKCESNANNDSLQFKHNILAGYGIRAVEVVATVGIISPTPNVWVINKGNDTLKTSANILVNPYTVNNYTLFTGAEDYRPQPGSIALTGASFTDSPLTGVTISTPADLMASIPGSVCMGTTNSLVPVIFVPSTTIAAGYCALSWSASPGVAISSTSTISPSFTVSTLGTFSVFLNVTNGDGNMQAVSVITTYTCLDVGMKNYSALADMVRIFPNPSSGAADIAVYVPGITTVSVKIMDISGKVVSEISSQALNAGENKIPVSVSLESGIYFVQVSSGNSTETVKMIIQK
jgi:hypothetical protein